MILDGGMGTALEIRKVEDAWSSGYRIDEPIVRAAVKDSYSDFLASGVCINS